MTSNFFSPLSLLLFLDPGSGMGKNQDPGSGINIPDPQHCWRQVLLIGIRNSDYKILNFSRNFLIIYLINSNPDPGGQFITYTLDPDP